MAFVALVENAIAGALLQLHYNSILSGSNSTILQQLFAKMLIWLESPAKEPIPCRTDKKQHGDSSGRGVGGGDAARIAVYESFLCL